jgi:hypothetical protein
MNIGDVPLMRAFRVTPSAAQRLYEIALCIPLFYPLFNYFWMLSFERLGLPGAGAVDTLLLILESGVLLLACVLALLEFPTRVILPYAIVLTLAGISVLVNPGVLPYLLESAKGLLIFCIPMIFLTMSIRDYGRLLSLFIRVSYVVGVMGIVVGVLMPKVTYSMWYSYMLLPALIFITTKQFLRYRIHDTALILALLLCIFLYGSRGALLCFGVALLLLVIWKLASSRRVLIRNRGIAHVGLGAAGIGAVSVGLFLWLGTGSSRLQSAIKAGGLFHDSGRSEIYEYVLRLIVEHPFGLGLHGERIPTTGSAGKWFEGQYAHNIFLEVVSHIGIVPGVLVFGIWGIAVAWLLKTNRDTALLLLLIGSFSIGFIQSLLSGTYLTNTPLWLFLAITISGNMRKERSIRDKADQPEAPVPVPAG